VDCFYKREMEAHFASEEEEETRHPSFSLLKVKKGYQVGKVGLSLKAGK
jgi:hypothetical protein